MAGMVQTQKADIDVRCDFNSAFKACLKTAEDIGTVKQQNEKLGFISLKTKRTWSPPCNPVTLRVTAIEKSENACNISFDAQCIDGLVGVGSCGKAIDKFINQLSDNL